MDAMSCPRCGEEMTERRLGDAHVSHCPNGHGVFLERADLGALAQAETDWHERSVHDTAQLPRITGDMTAPPVMPKQAGSWVETLFD